MPRNSEGVPHGRERAVASGDPGEKTPRCMFSGVGPIEVKRFLDSGTRLARCPGCVATRSLELQKGMLRFKSHDKRKTTTPNTKERWVRVDLAWSGVKGQKIYRSAQANGARLPSVNGVDLRK